MIDDFGTGERRPYIEPVAQQNAPPMTARIPIHCPESPDEAAAVERPLINNQTPAKPINKPRATFQFGRPLFSHNQLKMTIQSGSVATRSAAMLDEM